MEANIEHRPTPTLATRRKKRERRWLDRLLALAGMDHLLALPDDVRKSLNQFSGFDGPDQGALAN